MARTNEFQPAPRTYPQLPTGEIRIPPPGPRPAAPPAAITYLLPSLVMLSMTAVVVVYLWQSGSGQSIIMLPMMAGGLLATLILFWWQRKQSRSGDVDRRRRYTDILREKRQQLQPIHDHMRHDLEVAQPDVHACLRLAKDRAPDRLWARAKSDPDFLDTRLGLGALPLPMRIVVPEDSSGEPDSLIAAAQAVRDEFALVQDVPVCLPLRDTPVVGIIGARPAVRALGQALLVQLATHHSPRDLKLAVIYSEAERDQWAWARWLPHAQASGGARFVAYDATSAKNNLATLREELSARHTELQATGAGVGPSSWSHIVILLASPEHDFLPSGDVLLRAVADPDPRLACSVVYLVDNHHQAPPSARSFVKVGSQASGQGELILHDADKKQTATVIRHLDLLDAARAESFARDLAPIRIRQLEAGILPTQVSLLRTLGGATPEELPILDNWRTSDPTTSLAVPIGLRLGGAVQYLDMQQPRGEPTIDTGHGPHALVAGKTGKGKSELLHALIAGIATRFHPHDVCFAIFDFKPPAVHQLTFELPHVLNYIRLDDRERVPRALAALEQEFLKRRAAIFSAADGAQDLQTYLQRHRDGHPKATERLPYVLIIVDEFARFRAEFSHELVQRFINFAIAGRSYGARMILTTQTPAGIIPEQIRSNVGAYICFQVDEDHSKDMLGNYLASRLNTAGRGYLRQGSSVLQMFQGSYSQAKVSRAGESDDPLWHLALVEPGGQRAFLHERPKENIAGTEYNVLVPHIVAQAEKLGIGRLRRLWLEPLPSNVPLADVRPSPGGWDGRTWLTTGRWLQPIIGLCDHPDEQTQPPLQLDLVGRGHVYIAGGEEATRAALRAIISALALDHSPAALHIHILDFGGRGLHEFRPLPHVGSIIRHDDHHRLARFLDWLTEQVKTRSQLLSGHGPFAQARADGHTNLPALVVVVQNLEPVGRDDSENGLRQRLEELAHSGTALGIHLLLAGSHQQKFLVNLLEKVREQRLALRLSKDDAEFVVGRASPDLWLPTDIPGRGLFGNQGQALECQIMDVADETITEMRAAMKTAAKEFPPASLPTDFPGELPNVVALDKIIPPDFDWPAVTGASFAVPIGWDDATWAPAMLDAQRDGHSYLVVAPKGGGRTTVLTTLVLSLAAHHPPERVRFWLLDSYRRSLAPLQGLPHVRRYAVYGQPELDTTLTELAETLRTRDGHEALPLEIVIMDDYHLLGDQPAVKEQLKRHVLADESRGFRLVAGLLAGTTRGYDSFLETLKMSQSGMAVGSANLMDDVASFEVLLPAHLAKLKLPPGRALLYRQGHRALVQIAYAGESVNGWVARLQAAHGGRPAETDNSVEYRQMTTSA